MDGWGKERVGSVFQVRGGEGLSLGSPGGDLPKAEAVHSSLELFSGKMTSANILLCS